jgi:uncharacterized protein (UPF0332 family)
MSGSGGGDAGPGAADVIAYWLKKADAALASACSEPTARRYNFAANRAYYTAYYAASAASLAHGHRFTKHTGLRGGVHRELIKTGLLAPEWGRAFDRLFESRQRADYLALVQVDADEAKALILDAQGCVAALRTLAGLQRPAG